MADKKQKNTELRMRIPDGHREILEEYCRVFGTTPSATICGYIVEDLWQALARTRVSITKNYIFLIYIVVLPQSVENNLLSLRRKGIRFFPMTSILLERFLRSLDWIIS